MIPTIVMSHTEKQSPESKRIEFRSQAGKLLFVKTKDGYEIKCPRDKKVYLISYQEMITDYLTWDESE